MYLQRLHVQGFRSLADTTVTFQPGVTALVGENNAGKTNVIDAVRHLTAPLDGQRDLYLRAEDLYRDGCGEDAHGEGCRRTIDFEARYASDNPDDPTDLALYDQALNADRTTVSYHLTYAPPDIGAQRGTTSWRAGQTPTTDRDPEPGARRRIRHLYLPPLRDARRELASGAGNSIQHLVGSFLREEGAAETFRKEAREYFGGFDKLTPLPKVGEEVQSKLTALTDGVRSQSTGLGLSQATVRSVVRSLRMRLKEHDLSPQEVAESGLGYANLLYIATVLAQLHKAAEADLTVLLVEEPEAHLHPQLQTILMDCLREETENSQKRDRSGQPWLGRVQALVTTHSPHIATSVPPQDLVVLQRHGRGTATGVGETGPEEKKAPPAFHGTTGVAVRNLNLGNRDLVKVRNYLNATRSTLLFASRVLLVEGIAEAVLVPALGAGVLSGPGRRRLRGTAVVPIDGVDFDPYLRVLLDVDPASGQRIAQRVAVITDGDFYDPAGKQKVDRATNLRKLLADLGADEGVAKVFANETTLEPELLKAHPDNAELMRRAWKLQRRQAAEGHWRELEAQPSVTRDAYFATMFKTRKVRKGDFAQDLAALSADPAVAESLVAPAYFAEALRWITEESRHEH